MLTPNLVRHITDQEEIPARCHSMVPADVVAVMRYGACIGSSIEQHERLDRGMERARALIRQAEAGGRSLASGTVIVADTLSAGKGRFQRSWHAPLGGLWLTLIVANTLLPAYSRLYPLAAGAACCETLRHYGVQGWIKWVNDVHLNSKKVAGILVETETGPHPGEDYVLIGIGVNVNNDAFPAPLTDTAMALKTALGTAVDLDMFTARLLAKLRWNVGLLCYDEQTALAEGAAAAGVAPLLMQRWRQLSDTVGRRVQFGFDVQQKPQFVARVMAVNDQGGLVLRLDDGTELVENSGEMVYLE